MTVVQIARDADGLIADLDELEINEGRDIATNVARARAIEEAADLTGETEIGHRARLVLADMRQREGDVGAAARVFMTVHEWAVRHHRPALTARCHFHLALTYHYLGDRETSLEHAISAVELLGPDSPPGLRVIHLIRLANALAEGGVIEAARQRYQQAEQLAVSIGDLALHLTLLNNRAYTEYEWGALDHARVAAEQMRVVARTLGRQFLMIEHDTIANIQIGSGEYEDAVASVRAAMSTTGFYELRDMADLWLTLAKALRHLGRYDEAWDAMTHCQELCNERRIGPTTVSALAEQAELHAATGDHQAAFTTLKLHHAEAARLRNSQREAQVRTRQAIFETAEARREAEQFREQARRDVLTGLYNRRYVNEQLVVLATEAVRRSSPMSIAMIDLDHFKRINDCLSHEVGDQVLRIVGDMLSELALDRSGDGFAARLGGEEFLVVQVGARPAVMAELLDEFRRRVSAYGWPAITRNLPVSVSIGAVHLMPGPTVEVSELMAAADRNLYQAKDAGRNRLVLSPWATAEDLS